MTKAPPLPSVTAASERPFGGGGCYLPPPPQKGSQPGWGLPPLSRGGGPRTPKQVPGATCSGFQVHRRVRADQRGQGLPGLLLGDGAAGCPHRTPRTWPAGCGEVDQALCCPGRLCPLPPGSQERPSEQSPSPTWAWSSPKATGVKLWWLEAAVTHGCGFISLENNKPTALPARSLPKEPRSGGAPTPAGSLPWAESRCRAGEGGILGQNQEKAVGEEWCGGGGAGSALCGRWGAG